MRSPLSRAAGFGLPSLSWRPALSGLLGLSLLAGNIVPVFAQSTNGNDRLMNTPVNLNQSASLIGADRRVTLSFRNVEVSDMLRALAKKGNFNALVDDTVTGTMSVDLKNVTIQSALETVRVYGNLAYDVQGNSLIVTKSNPASAKANLFHNSQTQVFHLQYANSATIADLLRKSIFSGSPVVVQPDADTNSIIVTGSKQDMGVVQNHLDVLDKPREMRTWRLSQANAVDVASILTNSVFYQPQLTAQAPSTTNSAVRTLTEQVADSTTSMIANQDTSASSSGSSGGGGGGGSSSGTSSSTASGLTLRARTEIQATLAPYSAGPIIIPDSRLNTVTLLGTADQIAVAESMIPTLDRKLPQVILEVSLVEITDTAQKELGYNFGYSSNNFSIGSNNAGNVGANTGGLGSILNFATNPVRQARDVSYQLNALISKSKAKLLANPSVISTSDNESAIRITDQIISSVSVTTGNLSNGNTTPGQLTSTSTATDNLGEVGIVLHMLPRIGADRSVTLQVHPTISTIASTTTDRYGNLVTLLSTREAVTQSTTLKDGESFILGGLMQDTNNDVVAHNPLLSNLPILGALSRNSTKAKKRSELVILITPHILNDESQVGLSTLKVKTSQRVPATVMAQAHGNTGTGNDGMVPVALNGPEHLDALPPMDSVHRIGGPDAPGSDTSGMTGSSSALPASVSPSLAAMRQTSMDNSWLYKNKPGDVEPVGGAVTPTQVNTLMTRFHSVNP